MSGQNEKQQDGEKWKKGEGTVGARGGGMEERVEIRKERRVASVDS